MIFKTQGVGNVGVCTMHETDKKAVVSVQVAHTEKYTDSKGAEREFTHWVKLERWMDKEKAKAATERMKKGVRVYYEGVPSVEPYLSKDKQPAANLVVRVFYWELVKF